MNSEDAHTLIGAYVLNAVDDIERAAVARHLAGCEACTAEVAELRATAAQLGEAAAVPPPPALRSGVLAQIRRTRQASPLPRQSKPASVPAAVRRWRLWTAAAVAAAVLSIAGGVTTAVVQQRQLDAGQTDLAQMRAVIAAPDARVVATDVAGGRVSVVASRQLDQAVVVMSDLPEVNTQQAYQLWTITGGRPESAGVLAAGERSGTQVVSNIGSAELLAVTREPAGGSAKPTLPAVAGVSLHG